MSYSRILLPETRARLGGDVVHLNALHDNAYLHCDEQVAAYLDCDRRYRVSTYAVLSRPREAYVELLRLGGGRWTEREVAALIVGANLHLRRALAA
jgi:hypothetical protein